MDNDAEFSCAYCGEINNIFIDLSNGLQQSYVEDCQVCCQPNVLYISIDQETLDIKIHSDPES